MDSRRWDPYKSLRVQHPFKFTFKFTDTEIAEIAAAEEALELLGW